MSIWTESASQMYYRHAIKVRVERLRRHGWDIGPSNDDSKLLELLVEDPNGDTAKIVFRDTADILDQLWNLEWDFLARHGKPIEKKEIGTPFSNRRVRLAPLDTNTLKSYQSVFAG